MKNKKNIPAVVVYVSGGNVDCARSTTKDIVVRIFDVDNLRAEGKSEEEIDELWEKEVAKHPIY